MRKTPAVVAPLTNSDAVAFPETLPIGAAAPEQAVTVAPIVPAKAEEEVKPATAQKKPEQAAVAPRVAPKVELSVAKPVAAKPVPVTVTPIIPEADKFVNLVPAKETDAIAEGVALRDIEESALEEPADDKEDVLRAQQGLAQLFLSAKSVRSYSQLSHLL